VLCRYMLLKEIPFSIAVIFINSYKHNKSLGL
jgi:hypothetical protein